MKYLFEDNRQANILTLLKKGNSFTIDLLAEKLSVSPRSIRNDIKALNDELKDAAHIDTDNGIYSLRIFDSQEFQTIYTKIINTDDLMSSPSKRMDYIFGKLMRALQPVITDDLAYEMNVGRSTLIKDLNKLRSRIKPYQLTIAGKTSQGLMLQGAELNIRNYVIEHCYDSIYSDYPEDEVITETIDSAFMYNTFDLPVQKAIRQYLTLMMDRFLTGHYIGHLQDSYYALTAVNTFSFVDRLINHIGNILHVEFPIEEKIFVLLPIVGMRTPRDMDQMYQIELNAEVRPLLDKIVVRIRDELNLDIDTSQFAKEFMYHLMFMINRLRYGIRIENPLLQEIKRKYPLAVQLSKIASQVVEENCNVTVSDDELGFLAAYFSVFIEANNLSTVPQKIAIICESGVVTSRLIEMQVKNIINDGSILHTYSLRHIDADTLNTYDIVLSTVQIPFKIKPPIIYIDEIFDENQLRSKLKKAAYWQPNENNFDDNWYMISNIIKEEDFYDLSDYQEYEEAIQFMIDCLIDDEKVDVDFANRLKSREKQGSMVFDHGVAMPHTFQTETNDLTISIGVFHEPIIHNDLPVRLILLIALPEHLTKKQDKLLIRIYDEIITLVKDEELIEQITSSESYAEFLKNLYKRI